ncbi:hypothetical protein OY671_011700, partial [Metschnikowia pulcherrima]
VAEISRDYDERTRLTRFRFVFTWGGGSSMSSSAYGVFSPNAMSAREGYRAFGIAGAISMAGCVLGSAIGLHRTIAGWPPQQASSGKGSLGSSGEIRESFSHPACSVVMAGIACAMTSQGITFASSNYSYLYVWRFTPTALQIFPVVSFGSVIGASSLAG